MKNTELEKENNKISNQSENTTGCFCNVKNEFFRYLRLFAVNK